ncbi:AMP-binding protein [Cumulibacter manganitolerans]|uniref:AMP-binding protein n=1 Tax=Cumulibacter manganitolerans TaxID=1884992 RepID=UPI0012978953|nr:AMP-binding protein [Cumulibacter manganitolerans]
MSTVDAQLQILREQEAARRESWPAGIPRAVEYVNGERPLSDYLRWRGRINADKPAVHFYGRDLTFGRLDQESDAVAAYLIGNGLARGDRVALMMQNCPQYVVAYWGVIRAGAVVVPLNPMFKAAEVRQQLVDSGATVAIVQADYAALIDAVRPQTDLALVVGLHIADYAGADSAMRTPFSTEPAADPGGVDAMWPAVVATPTAGVTLPAPELDATAALNYTGGTTGRPKGCEHTQGTMLYTAAASATVRRTFETGADTSDSVSLSYLPVFWIAGENIAVIQPVYTGATCVLLTRWDAKAVLAAIDRFGVHGMSGTVDNYLELMDDPEIVVRDLSSLRSPSTMSFVTKLTPLIRQQWRDRAGPHSVLREGSYGMTETHTSDTFVVGFQNDDFDLLGEPTFVGLPVPGTEIKVCDFETGEVLPSNVGGEILVRTPSLMKGYWRNPEATAECISDGWFRTGDLGAIRDDGCLRYIGRRKEMLKVNGMSVFPTELESLLVEHPALAAVAVVGVADRERGERPRAYVELNGRRETSPEELTEWARAHVAGYKVPEFVIIDELPRTATGKVRKVDLLELPTPSSVATAARAAGTS